MLKLFTPNEARQYVLEQRAAGKTTGLIPTMGALHQGHLSLAKRAQEHCDLTIATIFVNPTQFGPTEDLQKYPRTLSEDFELLDSIGTSAVFVPSADMIYPSDFSTYVDPPKVAETLEGICRPGHFRGVATIVLKLFQMLPATHAFFGRKDYQQLRVIESMVRDLNVGIEIIPCETIREPDGLAMSSRNRYLSIEERDRALAISRALIETKHQFDSGERSVAALKIQLNDTLLNGAKPRGVDRIEYAEIVDAETLLPIEEIDHRAVALIACYVGNTRLIDNVLLLP